MWSGVEAETKVDRGQKRAEASPPKTVGLTSTLYHEYLSTLATAYEVVIQQALGNEHWPTGILIVVLPCQLL